MKKFNTFKIVAFIGVMAVLVTFILFLVSRPWDDMILKGFIILGVFYILFPFLKVNGKWLLFYFFDLDRDWWIAKVQRPRVLFYLVYFTFLFLLLRDFNLPILPLIKLIYNFSIIFYLIGGMYLLNFKIWSLDFDNNILPQLKEKIINKGLTFKKLSDAEINTLYDFFKNDVDELSRDNFFEFIKNRKTDSKINWKGDSGKKGITYKKLFILVHNMVEDTEKSFLKRKRRELLELLCNNFEKEIAGKKVFFVYKNLESSYASFYFNMKSDSIV